MSGASHNEIARTFGATRATVNKIHAFRNEGCIGGVAQRLARKTADQEGRAIVVAATISRFMTAGPIRDTLVLNVSGKLVRQRL